jgi:hypothetical protein
MGQTDSAAELQRLQELVSQARKGDLEVLPQLRSVLEDHPEVWDCGDIAIVAKESWIDLIAGHDLALKELLGRRAEKLRDDLAGPDPTPIERLLVDRIIACWLQVHHADAVVAQSPDMSPRQAEFARRRQDSAHRRYLTAIGALATIRKLLPASVDVRAEPTLPDGSAQTQSVTGDPSQVRAAQPANSARAGLDMSRQEAQVERPRLRPFAPDTECAV